MRYCDLSKLRILQTFRAIKAQKHILQQYGEQEIGNQIIILRLKVISQHDFTDLRGQTAFLPDDRMMLCGNF